MARRKKHKTYAKELNSLVVILLMIIGYFRFGLLGKLIDSINIFLFGNMRVIFYMIALFFAIYIIIKSKIPNKINLRVLGIGLIIIGLMIWVNLRINYTLGSLWTLNFEQFDKSITLVDGESLTILGSGVTGYFITWTLIKLIAYEGTHLIMILLFLLGSLFVLGKSTFINIFRYISKIRFDFGKKKHHKEIIEKANNYEKDTRAVVSSFEELIKHNHEPIKEESKEQLTLENFNVKGYAYPPITLLNKQNRYNKENNDVIKENVETLERVFNDFEIIGKVVAINVGPSVTQYEVELKAGTKVNKVLGIHKEIALALAAKDVRIQAPIPGKKTIGVEIPNKSHSLVTVREILETIPKNLNESKLLITLGKDIMGKPIFTEINKTPHLLVAGSTGSGKSVCINSMIISILMRARPDEVKLLLIDPKKVELNAYNGIPHLVTPVVTDPRKANVALKKIVDEMDKRYELFNESDSKNIAGYNLYVEKKNKFLPDSEKLKKIPYIVVIIDELADLMLVAAKEVEDSIMRITQMARAAGIHLVVATQRPSTDVITGLIKANIPSRISFSVSSSIDSRTILDMTGAEKLLGKGDMLFLPMGESTPVRVQGTYIAEEEIKAVIDFVISQQKAKYEDMLKMDEEPISNNSYEDHDDEPLYDEMVKFVVEQGKASASLLQRRFRLGYNRAARAIDLLEQRGIVGPSNGSKPREVLYKIEEKD